MGFYKVEHMRLTNIYIKSAYIIIDIARALFIMNEIAYVLIIAFL
jgi:hypothetical protein